MGSVIEELNKRTNEHPDKLLFAFLDIRGEIKESYSYREFQYRTDSIATYLHENYQLQKGDRVLLAYPPGLEIICAFFACAKLGLIPVPVYPPVVQSYESSIQKMNFIAQDCEASAILTDRAYYWSIKVNITRSDKGIFNSKSDYVSKLTWIVSDDAGVSAVVNYQSSHSEILFLQYTSGSTNNPKGVIVTHDNIIYNCGSVVDHDPIGVSWLPQYHDMGLIGYYLFFAIKGGTTYGFSPFDFIQRPALWLESISRFKATATSAPNFAYDYCLIPGRIPESTLQNLDLSSLSFVMTAAEPVNTKVCLDFIERFGEYGLKKESFFAAYGLAEFTLAVSSRGTKMNCFDTESLKQNKVRLADLSSGDTTGTSLMSCGKVLRDTKIKIVDLSSKPKEVNEGEVGELWLNGSGKCKGYWNRTELTNEIFKAKLPGDETEWLRTGDLGFVYEDGVYICGRSKDMIIIRGLNYYPQDIETIIENDSKVRKGCVAAFSVNGDGSKEELVVVVGLKSKNRPADVKLINDQLNSNLGIAVSSFVFIPARTISKTSSGKIMRNENKLRFLNDELQIIDRIDVHPGMYDQSTVMQDDLSEVGTYTETVLSEAEVLFKRYGLNGDENFSLGNAGLDSLKLAEFAHDLKEFIKHEGFDDLGDVIELKLLQKIAVSELYQLLLELGNSAVYSRFRFKQAFSGIQREFEKIESEMMKKDALLLPESDPDLYLFDKAKRTESHILLTGGTGFFGPFLIKSLLEQNLEDIYVIVRAKYADMGKVRLREAFMMIEPSHELMGGFEKRVKCIPGDISKSRLGLSEADWTFLSGNIQTIYHNGALVNYLMDYESMRNANVGGTVEIVRLAQSCRPKILNYISTTFIFGWSVKDTLYESDSNHLMENLDFGYSQSKWVAEQIVRNAMKNGLKARIFRPALISPSISGKGYNFDISIRLLVYMLNHQIGTNAKNQVSFSPADIAANNVVAISNVEESIDKTFNVTRDTYSNLQDVTDLFTRFTGKEFTMYELSDFVPQVVDQCTKEDLLFPLLNFLVRSEAKIRKMEFKLYDNSNYKQYRDQSPYGQQDTDLEKVVRGILQFMLSRNLVSNDILSVNHV